MIDTIEVLKKLVSVQSVDVDGGNHLIEYCKSWLKEQGIESQVVSRSGYKSLIATIGEGDKTLILNGHLDVVSGAEEQFVPCEKEGRIYGRGTADMKAGVAALMTVLAELKDQTLSHKVMLQLVTDEEIGGFNGSKYLVEQGFTGDFVICAEPTQLGLGIQAKGILQLDAEIIGRSAHGSRPWEGDNAILGAFAAFDRITQLSFAYETSPFYEKPSVNLAKIQGGDVYNKVPDLCKISLDIRFLPTQDVNEIIRQIKSVVKNVSIHATGTPVRTSIESPYVKLLAQITEKYTHKPGNIFGQHGSADTRFFAELGIPAIEFGPCGANWHGEDEYVDIASIETYKQILIDFIIGLN